MDYRDFILRIDARPGAGETLVVASPAGHGAKAPFASPADEEELRALATLRERAAVGPPLPRSRHLLGLGPGRPSDPLLQRVGDRLFRALLAGEVKECFLSSLGRTAARGEGLRIRLRFDLDDATAGPPPSAPHRLPWELLYRRETGEFLALGLRTLVVRDLAGEVPAAPPARSGPLVVLAAAAQPRGCSPLDLESELRSLELALASHRGGVEVRPLRNATFDELAQALRNGGVHALHFLGHGDLDEETEEGLLCLEDERGDLAPVSGSRLAHQIRDALPGLRLVFLNACRTGEAAAGAPWAGVATALVRAGAGAVVAMQHRMRDAAAITFSREVYRRLAAGDAVEAAVAEGRLAIARAHPGSPEWATPALFLRSTASDLGDGRSGQAGEGAEERVPRRGRVVALSGALVAVAGVAALVAMLGGGGSASPWEIEDAGPPLAEGGEVAQGSVVEGSMLANREPEEPEEPEAGPIEPRAEPAPALPEVREVAFGEPTYLPEARAIVTADLITVEGRELVRLTVAPDDGATQVLPGTGPGTLVFRWGDDHVSVDVLTIDREAGTVHLRASR